MARGRGADGMAVIFVVVIVLLVLAFSSPATTQSWLDSLQSKLGPKYDARKPGMKMLDWFGTFYSGFNDRFGRRAPRGTAPIQSGVSSAGESVGDANEETPGVPFIPYVGPYSPEFYDSVLNDVA